MEGMLDKLGIRREQETSVKKSASKSVSSAESNMPIFVIFIVIILIGVFLVGYLRNQKDDEY